MLVTRYRKSEKEATSDINNNRKAIARPNSCALHRYFGSCDAIAMDFRLTVDAAWFRYTDANRVSEEKLTGMPNTDLSPWLAILIYCV
jgi:hypothetical protein